MLKANQLRFLTKQLITSLAFPKTYFYEPRGFVKSHENNEGAGAAPPKQIYKTPLKTRQRKLQEKLQVEELKRKIQAKLDAELKGEQEEVKEAPKDKIFPDKEPEIRKYDKRLIKELYWNPRKSDFADSNLKKIYYLKEFHEPFVIHDENIKKLLEESEALLTKKIGVPAKTIVDPEFDLTETLKSDPSILVNLTKIKEAIPLLNYRLYPNIALYLGHKLRYKEDFADVWKTLELELFKVLHNMSPMEIAKLRYAMAGFFPKAGSPRLHKAFRDILKQDLKGCDIYELLHIYHAFRLQSSDFIHSDVFEAIINDNSHQKNQSANPNLASDVIYTYANCRLSTRNRRKFREPLEHFKEAQKLVGKYFDLIKNQAKAMSPQALTNLANAMTIMRLENFKDLVLRIERTILPRVDEFDAGQTATILYSYSKINGGLMGGKDDFYKALEKNVKKYWKEFNDMEKSRIFYAYTARAVLSKEDLDKLYLPWIKDNMTKFNYAELANIAYGLMFENVKDRDLWKQFAQNVSTQKYVCPVIHYRPIKIARFYMEALFPEWDFTHFENTCFEAERYFNIDRLSFDFEQDEFYDITKSLRVDLGFPVKIMYEWENLFHIDYAIQPNKIAILIQKNRDTLPNKKAKPMHLLRETILKQNGFKTFNIVHEDYVNMGPNRNDFIKKELDKLMDMTKDSKQKEEEARRDHVFAALEKTFNYSTKKPLSLPNEQ